jgi:hypothetical protein
MTNIQDSEKPRATNAAQPAAPATSAAPAPPGAPVSIFSEDWWLDAAVPGAWRRIEVYWDRSLVASMAVHFRRRYGLRVIEQPPLTRSLTPILDLPDAKPAHALQNRLKALTQLLEQLPPHDRFEANLEPDSLLTLPFALLGYGIAQTYTFRADPSAPGFSISGGMHQKARNTVSKAARNYAVERTGDITRFLKIHHRQRARESLLDEPTVCRLFEAAAARGRACVLVATDANMVDVGACSLIWDHQTLYYWLSTRDPAATGVNSLLIVKAVELAAELGKLFDLDGFASKDSGAFLARFGLNAFVRPFVNKSGRLWKAMNAISALADPDRFDRNYRF